MNPHALLTLLLLNGCYYHGSADIIRRDVNLTEQIARVARNQFAGRSLTGFLCWSIEGIKKLSGILAVNGIYFRNNPQKNTKTIANKKTIDNQLFLVDMTCRNWMEGGTISGDVLIVDGVSCDDLFEMPVNALGNIFVLHHGDNIERCVNNEKRSGGIIEVAYISSEETAKNIHDFRRNLQTEVRVRFNHQLFKEIFSFVNITQKASYVKAIPRLQELIALPVTVSSANFTLYNFLSTSTPNRATFLLRAPALSTVSNVFTLPLELKVWYASYILIVILLVAFVVVVRVERLHPQLAATGGVRLLRPRLADVVHLHVGAIAQQGSEAEPASGGGRIATFLAFLAFLFLYTAYSANIVALLGSTTTGVHDVEDLRDFGVRLGVDDGGAYSRDVFAGELVAAQRALYTAKLARDDCWMPADEGVQRVREEFFAFHADTDRLYKMIERTYVDNEKCGFVEIPFLAEPEMLVPLRKDSVHKEILKIGY